MRVLFDQNVPRKLRPFLKKHEIRTADEQGWATISNGELLNAAQSAGFDVVVTVAASIDHAKNNRYEFVELHAPWRRGKP